jgi:predicted ArsR family transcriptional regulator
MLEKLLNEIRAGGTLETGALAARLGTSPQLVEAMLEHLQRSGLIRAYDNCGDGCQGCGLRDACGSQPRRAPRLWQSTSEG